MVFLHTRSEPTLSYISKARTQKRRESFDFYSFGDDEAAAPLFARWLAHYGDGVFGTSPETVGKSASARRSSTAATQPTEIHAKAGSLRRTQVCTAMRLLVLRIGAHDHNRRCGRIDA